MIRVIEGTDAVGKSTFAQSLSIHHGAEYRHASAPTHQRWAEEYVNPLVGADGLPRSLVLDRWHLGEWVWPDLFGRPSLFGSWRTFQLCNQAISLLGATVTVVYRDEAGIRRTLEARGEGETAELVLEGQRRFLDLAGRIRHLPVTVVHSDVLHRNVSGASACTSTS